MLNYEIYDNGSNNWIIFIHGIGGSTKTWKKQIKDFSQDYNLLLLDLPGHGKSESIPVFDVAIINDMIIEVMDHVGISSADFVSMSLGTMVASHFAVQYPERVKSLIQGGATMRVDGVYKLLMNVANTVKRMLPRKVTYQIFAHVIMPRTNHAKSRSIFIRESKKLHRKDFMRWVGYLHENVHPQELLSKLKSLNIKMCFISGEEDACFLDGVKKVVAALPKATLAVIQKCGHVCTIEKAKEFNRTALLFLKQRVPAPCVS